MTIQKILAIADASRDALNPMLDALRVVQKERLATRIILLSFLSVLSEKHLEPLGPNTLFLLIQEEQDILEKVRNHFKMMDIPCSLQHITSPVWKEILDEMENGDQDLIILQGQFLKMWNEGPRDFGLYTHAIFRPKCPVLVINQPGEMFLC
jgi:hypothetical protein